MKSLMYLATEILDESGSLCGVSTTRDRKTITDRFEDEGVSFLTITLPRFGKDFERSLELGTVADDLFHGFKRGKGGLPRFLGGFLQLVFDLQSGSLLDEPNMDAIFSIRQICLAFGKIFALPSNKRQREAMRQYIEIDREVQHETARNATAFYRSSSDGRTPERRYSFVRLGDGGGEACSPLGQSDPHHHGGQSVRSEARLRLQEMYAQIQRASLFLFVEAVAPLDARAYAHGFMDHATPRHGPGSTAEGLLGNAKHKQTSWPIRAEREFPFLEWALPNYRFRRELGSVTFLSLANEIPVKVISVPKTMKTPRIIAKEPVAMMYLQQALMRELTDALESSRILSPMIGFTSQAPNRRMAVEGSLSGKLATLDMSEASDRVSLLHVRALLKPWPNLLRMVLACRSRKADVPGYGVRHLAKYASMGSALTFPLEAMVFLSIIVAAVAWARSEPVSKKLLWKLHGKVRVFGDDIIVPADTATVVIEWLEAFGLKVNHSKSFWTGKFRESCGVDAYDGQDITPVRFRQFLPRSRESTEEIISLISTRNQFYKIGYWRVAGYLDNVIRRYVSHFPIVEETSPIHGRTSVSFEPMAERICKDYQVPLVKGLVVKEIPRVNPLDDFPALMKWFLHVGSCKSADEDDCARCAERMPMSQDHLKYSGRPKTTHNLGWRQPY